MTFVDVLIAMGTGFAALWLAFFLAGPGALRLRINRRFFSAPGETGGELVARAAWAFMLAAPVVLVLGGIALLLVNFGRAAAVYFLVWWITLFAVLPWGVRRQDEAGAIAAGTDPGAPLLPAMGRKLLWTTVISLTVFATAYLIYAKGWVTMDNILGLYNWR